MSKDRLMKALNNPEVQRAIRRSRRKSKVSGQKEYVVGEPNPEYVGGRTPESVDIEDHTHSIHSMLELGAKTIYDRYEQYLRDGKTPLTHLRIDYYYIKEDRQWYSCDMTTPEGRLMVKFLQNQFGSIKTSIEGKRITSHFWLEIDFMPGAKGVTIFDDSYNNGRFTDYEEDHSQQSEDLFTPEEKNDPDFDTGADYVWEEDGEYERELDEALAG